LNPPKSATWTITSHVLVTGDKPTIGLGLAGNVITILVVAILIPLRRLNGRLTVATNESQEDVSISIVIVICLHSHSVTEHA